MQHSSYGRWTSSSRSSEASSPLRGDHEAIKESVLTYIYDLLKNNGPQLCTGPMTWLRGLSSEAEKLIGGRDHLADFLNDDEAARFRVYKDKYICIVSDLPKAIRMSYGEETPYQIVDADVDTLGKLWYNRRKTGKGRRKMDENFT